MLTESKPAQYVATLQSADDNPYRAIHSAGSACSHSPRDERVLVALIQAYVRLGLRGPARELTALLSDALRAELAGALRGSTGRVAWGARTEQFERNLAGLARRGVDIDAVRSAWRPASREFELYTDSLGNDQVRVRMPDGGWQWTPSLANHREKAAAAPAPTDAREPMPGPYLFDGVAHGLHLQKIWRASRNGLIGYRAAVYVVEPDLAAFVVALHMADLTEPLADDAVFWFVGPAATERFVERLLPDPNLPTPRLLFAYPLIENRPAGRATLLRNAIDRLIDTRQQQHAAAVAAWRITHEAHGAAYWRDRMRAAWVQHERPLRVLAAISTHTTFLQYSMRDALHALEELGCQTRLLSDPRPYEKISSAAYHHAIREFDPDLLLSIDHLRNPAAERIPWTLPQITWDQDNLPGAFSDKAASGMGPHDVVVGLPHIELVARGGAAAERCLASQMPTSLRRFDQESLDAEKLARFRCDVSYVSHASQTAADFHVEEQGRIADAGGRKLLDRVYELCTARPATEGSIEGGSARAILRQAEADTGIRIADAAIRERFEGWYIWRLCDRMFRHQALEWAGAWARRTGRVFRIFGNGWERHPTLAPFAAGPCDNDRDLLAVYNASAINLQLMPAGFLHQRAIDGIAAGGFFLTRRTRADRRDPRLPDLWRRIKGLGANSADEFLSRADSEQAALFAEVGQSLGYGANESAKTFEFVRFDSQWDYAAEAIPDFDAIAFEDAAGFENAAERFLLDSQERRRLASSMRAVVVARYSYQAKMKQFVDFLFDWLNRLAGNIESRT